MWKHVSFNESYLKKMVDMTIDNYGLEEAISHEEFVRHEYLENPLDFHKHTKISHVLLKLDCYSDL